MMSLFLILCVTLVSCSRDFYKILGVSRTATNKEIKKAARKLQLKYHPDKCDGDHCEAKFIEVAEAFETLVDDEKRAHYDRFGETDAQHPQHQRRNDFDAHNVFESFFGGGFRFNMGQQRQNQKVEDLYQNTQFVVKMGPNSFKSRVERNAQRDVWLIQMYSPHCRHCRQFEPQLDKLATSLHLFAKVGAINAEHNADLAHRYGVSAYPAFLVFVPGHEPFVYKGELNAKKIGDFVVSSMPMVVQGVRGQHLEKFLLTRNGHAHVLLLSSQSHIPSLMRALALRFDDDKLVFGNAVSAEVAEVLAALEITETIDLPALLMLEPTNDPFKPTWRKYNGAFDMRSLEKFVRRYEHRNYGVPVRTLEQHEAEHVPLITSKDGTWFRQHCSKSRCAVLMLPKDAVEPPTIGQADETGAAHVDPDARDRVQVAAALRTSTEALVRTWKDKYASDPVSFGMAAPHQLAGWSDAFGTAKLVVFHAKRRRFATCTERDVAACTILLDALLSGGSGGNVWESIPEGLMFL